jgi:hypothetical protein
MRSAARPLRRPASFLRTIPTARRGIGPQVGIIAPPLLRLGILGGRSSSSLVNSESLKVTLIECSRPIGHPNPIRIPDSMAGGRNPKKEEA